MSVGENIYTQYRTGRITYDEGVRQLSQVMLDLEPAGVYTHQMTLEMADDFFKGRDREREHE